MAAVERNVDGVSEDIVTKKMSGDSWVTQHKLSDLNSKEAKCCVS